MPPLKAIGNIMQYTGLYYIEHFKHFKYFKNVNLEIRMKLKINIANAHFGSASKSAILNLSTDILILHNFWVYSKITLPTFFWIDCKNSVIYKLVTSTPVSILLLLRL